MAKFITILFRRIYRMFSKPVIWSFVGSRDTSDSVRTALRNPRITHVAIFSGNRVTSNTLDKTDTLEAIKIAKANGAAVILVRYLWQTQPSGSTKVSVLHDQDYYNRQIKRLRAEAKRIGARYTAFDIESYGPTDLHDHFRSKSFDSSPELSLTIQKVINWVGQVDFILPAGSARKNHPITMIAGLGKQRISEHTYYDNDENIASIKYPYEISGMYVNTEKENSTHAHLPYFLASEVFGSKSYIWKSKQGLLIWPREHRALEVAQAVGRIK